jgi:hypothetical protein
MGFTTFNRRDAQRFRKVYPRIRKTPRYFTISDEAMSVESAKVTLTNETSGEFNFQLEYDFVPTVVLTAEHSSDSQGMVNTFVTSLTLKKIMFETSAPFNGTIHIQIFKIGNS